MFPKQKYVQENPNPKTKSKPGAECQFSFKISKSTIKKSTTKRKKANIQLSNEFEKNVTKSPTPSLPQDFSPPSNEEYCNPSMSFNVNTFNDAPGYNMVSGSKYSSFESIFADVYSPSKHYGL